MLSNNASVIFINLGIFLHSVSYISTRYRVLGESCGDLKFHLNWKDTLVAMHIYNSNAGKERAYK